MAGWRNAPPISEDTVEKRKAWAEGWKHRMATGPGLPDRAAVRRRTENPALLSAWLQGYAAADKQQRTGQYRAFSSARSALRPVFSTRRRN